MIWLLIILIFCSFLTIYFWYWFRLSGLNAKYIQAPVLMLHGIRERFDFSISSLSRGQLLRFINSVESHNLRRSEAQPSVSRQAALSVGLEIEKLACALDTKDVSTLTTMAGNLRTTAGKFGLSQIAGVAADLQGQAAEDRDWTEIVTLGADLLELCRSTQSALLGDHEIAAL